MKNVAAKSPATCRPDAVETRFALIGAHLRTVEVPGVTWFAIESVQVSSIPFDASVGTANSEVIRRALQLRKALIERDTFVAIRYGVSVTGRTDAIAKCVAQAERWAETLKKYDGLVEVTLRISGTSRPSRPDRKDFQSGSDYLRALHAATAPTVSDETRRAVEDEMVSTVVSHKWSSRADGGSEFAALVRRDGLNAVGTAGENLQKRLPGVPFLLSGPWPLEAFADEE